MYDTQHAHTNTHTPLKWWMLLLYLLTVLIVFSFLPLNNHSLQIMFVPNAVPKKATSIHAEAQVTLCYTDSDFTWY